MPVRMNDNDLMAKEVSAMDGDFMMDMSDAGWRWTSVMWWCGIG